MLSYFIQSISQIHQPLINVFFTQSVCKFQPFFRYNQRRINPKGTVFDKQITQNIKPRSIISYIIQRPAKLRNILFHLFLICLTLLNHLVQLQKQNIIIRFIPGRQARIKTL